MGHFDELSDLDFEEFAADLLSAVTKLEFRAGTRGRDGGIDLEATDDGDRHIAQCKHYTDSTYPQLKAAAKKEARELAKRDFQVASYRFVTSRRLNHDQRKEIAELLQPWVGSVQHVLGDGDLRRHLKKHPEVERRNVKLWLRSVGQLRQSLSAASYERSRVLLEETRQDISRYVQTLAFSSARQILQDERVCVIAGPAGVGKTTLARLLLLDSIEAGYQPFEIVPGGLRDAWELLELDEKQIFYFDDFLGRTALFESREQDQDLIRFLRGIARDPQRRIVLTTREYILAQAHRVSEALDLEADQSHRYFLSADHYTRYEQARIFYNHLYFSKVDARAKAGLVIDHKYMDVIEHPNYNPRLIEWMTAQFLPALSEEEESDYGTFCLNVLNKPNRLWRHVFESGLGEHERALLIAFLGLKVHVSVEMLETAFEAACESRGLVLTGRQFDHALAVLDDSFLSSEEGALRLANPSIIDFLREYVSSSNADAAAAIRGACFFEQVEWFWQAAQEDSKMPPKRLLSDYADAFERLIESSPDMYASVDRYRDPGDPERSTLGRRLRRIADGLDDEAFKDLVSPWLPAYAQQWLDELAKMRPPERFELELALRLIEHGILDPEPAGRIAMERIADLDWDVDRWTLLDALHQVLPEVMSAEEKVRTQADLARFLDEALDDPGEKGVLLAEDLDELVAVAGSWGLDLDLDKVREEREELQISMESQIAESEEWEKDRAVGLEADWLANREHVAKQKGLPSPADEDAFIHAMFARFAEEASR